MRKIIIAGLTALAAVLPAMSQTDFRHITFDEAKTAAKAEGKRIFIDFYTTWCGPCRMLATKVFPQKQIGDYLNSKYVCLKIDAEKGEGVDLAKKFKVKAYPTLAVADENGDLVGSFEGLKEGSEFISAVEMCNNPEMQPERIKARYDAGERNTPLVLAYAAILRENARTQEGQLEAVKVLDDYFSSLSAPDRANSDNIGLFTTYAWSLSNPRVRYLIDHRDEFASEFHAQLDEIIHDAYREGAMQYFSSNQLKDDAKFAEYTGMKREIADHGFADEFATLFEFTEKRKDCDDAEYLAFCDENFSRLDATGQFYLATSVTNIFTAETPEQKKTLSGFLRKHISAMDASSLYWTAGVILQLENGH